MADFKYVGQVSGLTIGAFKITLTGTVEAGDFLGFDRAKADATDVELAYLAMEAGEDGDDIDVYPVLAGMIFEGVADGDIAEKGTQVALAIATADQVVDATGGTNLFFISLDTVDVSEDSDDLVRVMYVGAYHNDLTE